MCSRIDREYAEQVSLCAMQSGMVQGKGKGKQAFAEGLSAESKANKSVLLDLRNDLFDLWTRCPIMDIPHLVAVVIKRSMKVPMHPPGRPSLHQAPPMLHCFGSHLLNRPRLTTSRSPETAARPRLTPARPPALPPGATRLFGPASTLLVTVTWCSLAAFRRRRPRVTS